MHKLPFCNCVFKTLPLASTTTMGSQNKKTTLVKSSRKKKERGTGKNKRTIEKHPADKTAIERWTLEASRRAVGLGWWDSLPLPSILLHYKQTRESRRVPFPAQRTVLHKVQLFESCVINAGKWKKSSFNVQCRRNILWVEEWLLKSW